MCYLYFLLITRPTACPQLIGVFCLEFSFRRPTNQLQLWNYKKYINATTKAEWKFPPISEVSRARQLQLRNAIIKKQQLSRQSPGWSTKILPENANVYAPHLYIYLTLSFPHSAISFPQWLLHLWDKFLLSTTIKLHFRVYGLRLPAAHGWAWWAWSMDSLSSRFCRQTSINSNNLFHYPSVPAWVCVCVYGCNCNFYCI